MPRADIGDVKAVLPSHTTLTDPQIQAAIDGATTLVDRISESGGCAQYLSVTALVQVEIYLSAHLAAVTENTLSLASETKPGCGSTAKYGFKFDDGVMGTPFGQIANTLSGGCLREEDRVLIGLAIIGSAGGNAEDYFNE